MPKNPLLANQRSALTDLLNTDLELLCLDYIGTMQADILTGVQSTLT